MNVRNRRMWMAGQIARLPWIIAAAMLGGCDDVLGVGAGDLVVSGRVVMAGDRGPVAGARLVATTNLSGEWRQHQRAVAQSAADGSYTLSLDCPRGAELYVTVAYEQGRSVLGEPGRDDLVLHAAERNGQPVDDHLLSERVACSTRLQRKLDFLLKVPTRGPVAVAGGNRYTILSAGSEAVCGVTPEGSAHCWGNGALGDGRYRAYNRPGSLPVQVAGGHSFTGISVGTDLVCGVTTMGRAYCWGGYHTNGVGDGTLAGSPRLEPVPVAGDLAFRTIAVGGDHACALTEEGQAYCWGANLQGQLGVGSLGAPSPQPVAVTGGLRFDSIVAGALHTCALTTAGVAYCWGNGAVLGANRTEPSAVPLSVVGGHVFRDLSAGLRHTCGRTESGAALCWGANATGELGSGTPSLEASLSPVPVASATPFSMISAGNEHTCALGSDQRISCWGSNETAQFGSPSPARSSTPVAAAGERRFASIAAGRGGPWGGFTCALDAEEAAFCWGTNSLALGAVP